ncbi:hypothetical protein Clacol_009838 [Clathrus columnatus]|uniref:Uncharacterized protein n=1 Tax=Clathrus columnatus TaxID=1419009 RepID=A0AAV5AS36_9AGAM|nr:hypothetical protein Clacol_009838 [Clathrus columnatus]
MVDLGAFGNTSPVANLAYRACDPTLHEPNYAVQLELADYINKKKANTPREAAMTIVRLINHRNPHVSLLALSLLDTLVESCGYPFHLQISTKEFLNELVRRFPERPPFSPGPVMARILGTIHGWKEGICTTSRWKEDLGNIRDMHRLLSFKELSNCVWIGYRFRDLPRTGTALASGSQEIKSADELESEDREAQAAKLQELIRRGTPRDLAAAQELMKIMAGADPDAKPDYRTQSLKELNKLEQKVILLNEMLDNIDKERRERWAAGDVYDQVAAPLMSARPKIQKWISDAETDDPESLALFLQLNDQINNVLTRFDAFKKGDYEGVANAVPTNLVGSSGVHSQSQSRDLIDLLDDEQLMGGQSSANTVTDDLASIFGGSSGVTPANNGGNVQQTQFPLLSLVNNNNGNGSPFLSAQGGIVLPSTPQPALPLFQPSSSSSSSSGLFSSTSYQTAPSVSPQHQTQHSPPQTQQNKDPFADLAGLF